MSGGVIVHMALALTGDVAFVVAGVSGVVYLVHERQLKAKNPAFLRRAGPSLEALDRVNLAALWIGFVLFTAGVLHGAWLARGRLGWADPKAVFTLATWGVYAALLAVRTMAWSRGPKIAAISALGLLLVGFTFVGVNTLLQSQHTFF